MSICCSITEKYIKKTILKLLYTSPWAATSQNVAAYAANLFAKRYLYGCTYFNQQYALTKVKPMGLY